MRQQAGELHFALESSQVVLAGTLRGKELHGRGTAKHGMPRLVDDAHPTFTDLLVEGVLPELRRFADSFGETVDRVGNVGGDDDRGRREKRRYPSEARGREVAVVNVPSSVIVVSEHHRRGD